MQAEPFTRHSKRCPHYGNRYYRKCRCRKWIALFGVDNRVSAKTRSWEQAERMARQMSADPSTAPTPPYAVSAAVKAYIEDKGEQNLSKNWQRKIKREVEDFSEWCHTNVVLELSDIRLKTLEDYRKTWPGARITRRKRQERLRSFFLYCARHEWITKNHAKELSPIKVKDVPTVPLTPGQFQAVLKASEDYNPKAPDREYWRRRAKAMLLLLRWSGLRIGDAARLERNRLTPSGAVMLYMQKTGEPVYVPLPPDVVQMLREFPNSNSAYFFWNGVSAIESPGKRWWSTMKKIFKSAGIPDAHPHMLRDTFAVELLLSGASLEEVSVLLGHSSVKITEKHYKPWVRSRQIQLEERVRKSW